MRTGICTILLLTTSIAVGAPTLRNSTAHPLTGGRYEVIRGEIDLSAEGYWDVTLARPDPAVKELYLVPPVKKHDALLGRRMREVLLEKRTKRGRTVVSQLVWPCREYAKEHGNVGPSSVSDLDAKRYKYLVDNISRSPWRDEPAAEQDGPFVFLVPSVPFEFDSKTRRIDRSKRRILAMELRPYVDDGKHWVGYTDGVTERVAVNSELLAEHGLRIRPILSKAEADHDNAPTELAYTVLAVREKAAPIRLVLRNTLTDEELRVNWNPERASAAEAPAPPELAQARQAVWKAYARTGGGSTVTTWASADPAGRGARRPRNDGRNLSAFGILGGRAAVQETLQLHALSAAGARIADRSIPVDTLQGVTVQSHPYAEMLGAERGGTLPLADLAPPDHFFVHVAKPTAINAFLDKGASFLARLGSTLTANSIDYDLRSKYLARLGFNEQWLRTILKSDAITECALVFPDLFFVDGTDVTAISRFKQPRLLLSLLKLVGVDGLSSHGILAADLGDDRAAYWALRDDLVFVGTSRTELERVLALHSAGGKGSLGRSAEFRYMLTQLPREEATRIYAYFSDPFIRRLVGPRTKIGQVRRITARADMEFLSSCALRARLDGIAKPASLDTLVTNGYVPKRFLNGDHSLDNNLVAHSRLYGTPSHLKTLAEIPVTHVTQAEADAYKNYLTEYTRYWVRFFDPIAIRINDMPDRTLEATTFILPLIENSIYDSVREMVLTREDDVVLTIPTLEPTPILTLSLNLRDKAWQGISSGLSDLFTRYAHVSPAVLDDLGPSLHLAIHDADPVIALGSGDILGAFGADMLQLGGNEMLFIPVLVSVLTRPCTLIIESRDAAKTRRYLQQAASTAGAARGNRDRELNVEFYEVEGKDAWVWSFDLMGLAKLRYGLEVQGNFLLLRNIPWSNKDHIARVDRQELNGARLRATPAACERQLAGLHAAAAEQYRTAALGAMSALYPLLISGHATLADAAATHKMLFGFKPVHPGDGQWIWKDFQLASSQYGSVFKQRQPAHRTGTRNFGLLADIEHFQVGMQLEDTGLRTKVRWRLR